MKIFTGNLISYFVGWTLLIKRIFLLEYNHFNSKHNTKIKKGNILIASNTTSALRITNLELYFAKLLYKNNYDVIFYSSDGQSCCSLWQQEREKNLNITINDIKRIESISCDFISTIICLFNYFGTIKYKKWKTHNYKNNKLINIFLNDYKKNLKKKTFQNCEIHEHTISTLVRYIGRPCSYEEITKCSYLMEVYIFFLKIACSTVLDWNAILNDNNPELVIINHGLYIPQGVVLEVAKIKGIKVKTFHPGYRKRTIITGSGDTYHKTLVDKNIDYFLERDLSNNEKEKIINYLESRRYGFNDQITFVHKNAEKNPLPKEIKDTKDFVLILTNVAWDAQGNYKENVYRSMNEWLIDIIALASKYKHLQFVFRCHPAEVTGRRISSTRTADFLEENSNGLENIFIIKSEEKISTYKLIEKSKSVIVYATKTSIEAACLGKSVLVCGESFIRGKEIGIDLLNKNDLEKSFIHSHFHNKVNVERSLKYAYYFFYKEMIDIPSKKKNNREEENNFIKKLLSFDNNDKIN